MHKSLKYILPVVVLLLAIPAAKMIVAAKPEAQQRQKPSYAPTVRVIEAATVKHQYIVRSQGSVQARVESSLSAEVFGQVIWTSSQFLSGGFFTKGEILLRLDSSDYESFFAKAEAEEAAMRLRLSREKEEAIIAQEEWARLESGSATDLVLRKPQLAEAQAALYATQAAVDKARKDLQ